MLVQISGGSGPVECSIAVEKLCHSLLEEYEGAKLVSFNADYSGKGYKSAVLDFDSNVNDILGTVQWISKSAVRPGHKRKNWFVDVSELPVPEEMPEFNMNDCQIETMHCGGNGGQNVNKVESGVRIKHIPTGIVVECREERSQYMNKQKALKKLQAVLQICNLDNQNTAAVKAWKKHTELVRGNPVRIYEGEKFVRVMKMELESNLEVI